MEMECTRNINNSRKHSTLVVIAIYSCIWLQVMSFTSAFRMLVNRSMVRRAEKGVKRIYTVATMPLTATWQTADAWAEGKNAAPAIMCEVENIPLLDPVPEGCKRLFMVRHGEVINPGGDRAVYYGSMDVPLSPLGEKEAIAAASYLSRFNLQHVSASPLSRAQFGARQVLAYQQQLDNNLSSNNIITLHGFKELDRGAWCGLTKDEIGLDNLARFDACDESVTPGNGGESYPTLKQRVLQSRDELLQMTDIGQASAIVSHLQVTRAMLSEALGMDVTEMAGLKVATASITCVDYCSMTGREYVRFQSFKPDCGLGTSKDGAN